MENYKDYSFSIHNCESKNFLIGLILVSDQVIFDRFRILHKIGSISNAGSKVPCKNK